MKKLLPYLIFTLIILIATFLRFYNLGSIPTSLTIDEVNNGYNAYSLLKTGKDEWGFKLPPYFKSTGDYDSPLLIYVTVPSVMAFGLTEFATRFPVALFSLLSIPVFFLLCKKYIFSKKSIFISLTSTFFFATSQWHIFYSRSDFEAVIALFFLLVNIYFLFQTLEKKSPVSLYLALFFAYLSTFSYHSNKIFAPLINFLFIGLNWKALFEIVSGEIKNNKRRTIILSFVGIYLIYFFVKNYIFGPGAARSAMVFFTQDFDYKIGIMRILGEHGMNILSLPLLFFFWIKRFLEYFSLNFYAINSLGLTITGQPGSGVINIALLPLYLSGLASTFIFLGSGSNKKTNLFLLGWLLIGFLPSSIANNSQHPLRCLNASVAVILFSTIGLSVFIDYLKRKSKKFIYLFIGIFIIIFSVDFVRFLDYYTIHYPYELSEYRQYGWKEMAIFARDHHTEYDNVYVDPRFGTEGRTSYGVPYLYFLFYSQYDPKTYHDNPLRKSFSSSFENYIFTEINWPEFDHSKNNLYIASPWSLPAEVINSDKLKFKVLFLNQASGLYAVSD